MKSCPSHCETAATRQSPRKLRRERIRKTLRLEPLKTMKSCPSHCETSATRQSLRKLRRRNTLLSALPLSEGSADTKSAVAVASAVDDVSLSQDMFLSTWNLATRFGDSTYTIEWLRQWQPLFFSAQQVIRCVFVVCLTLLSANAKKRWFVGQGGTLKKRGQQQSLSCLGVGPLASNEIILQSLRLRRWSNSSSPGCLQHIPRMMSLGNLHLEVLVFRWCIQYRYYT